MNYMILSAWDKKSDHELPPKIYIIPADSVEFIGLEEERVVLKTICATFLVMPDESMIEERNNFKSALKLAREMEEEISDVAERDTDDEDPEEDEDNEEE